MTEAAVQETSGLRAMILAAGYGSRLAPVTDHLPKPLLPVAGEPLLDRVIGRILGAGFAQVAVNSHHLGGMVASHLAAHPEADRLRHFPEAEILGTGGALDNARDFLNAGTHFLVHNGDVLCDVDLGHMVSAHLASGALATLLLVDWPAVNSVTMGPDGALRHIGGVGQAPAGRADDRQLTYTGIGVFAREVLAGIAPGFSSLVAPLATAIQQSPGAVRGFAPAGMAWDDLGTLGRWLGAPQQDTRTAGGFELTRITGHGSDRRFWRLGLDDWSAVAMVDPARDGEFERFVASARFLQEHRLGAPQLLSVDEGAQAVLMEDLGGDSLHALAAAPSTGPERLAGMYTEVVDHLLAWQEATPAARRECPLAVDRVLDRGQLQWETSYFRERFLQGYLGRADHELRGLAAEFAALADFVAAMPQTLVHRDFQSQNILLLDGRVRLVDFQGLRLGPLTYDLASLVWDPYVALPADLRARLVARYAAGQSVVPPAGVAALTVAAGLQRVMQALGAFGFLGLVKAKSGFLAHIPAAVRGLQLLLTDLAAHAGEDHWPAPMPRLTKTMAAVTAADLRPRPGERND